MDKAAEPAAGVAKARESQGFDWSGFFWISSPYSINPYTLMQIVSLLLLLYAVVAGDDEVGPMLVWFLFILPPWLVCVFGSHLLRKWMAKLEKQSL